jgi:phosphoribosylformylglycinamidine cyclo-ligase
MKCNIATLRKQNNLTQRQLAVILETDASTVSRWENLHQYPEVPSLWRLAAALNCTVDDLYSIA